MLSRHHLYGRAELESGCDSREHASCCHLKQADNLVWMRAKDPQASPDDRRRMAGFEAVLLENVSQLLLVQHGLREQRPALDHCCAPRCAVTSHCEARSVCFV